MNSLSRVLNYIHPSIKELINAFSFRDHITEIRLSRAQKPLVCTPYDIKVLDGLWNDEGVFDYSVNAITGGNLYSVIDKVKDGYITLPGGHRAGICASAVTMGKDVCNIKDISSICFRIAREIKGCGNDITAEILQDSGNSSVLVASPPGYGKTTVLRDICRVLSGGKMDGNIRKVGISDERGEIAAMHMGVPSFDIGYGAFVCDGYPKVLAISMMLRTMSPDFIVTDEIGSSEDFEAIYAASRCGVGVVASIHATEILDLRTRFGEKIRCFDKIFFIGNKQRGHKTYGRDKGDY